MRAVEIIALAYVVLSLIKVFEITYQAGLAHGGVEQTVARLPLTGFFARYRWLNSLFYRLHYMVIIMSVCAYNITTPWIAWTVAGVIVFLLWFNIFRMIADLVMMGTNRFLSSIGAPNFLRVPRPDLVPRQRVTTFIISIASLSALIIFGYSAAYHVAHHQFDLKAYQGVPPDGIDFLYFWYFSLVTFATVGYGDIIPHSEGSDALCRALSRVLVASEIGLSFLVVAVFIASYSLAFSIDEPTKPSPKNEGEQ